MMGLTSVLDISIVVRPGGLDEYDSELKVTVPFSATHLAEVGRELPGWVNPGRLDKVVTDWASAAERPHHCRSWCQARIMKDWRLGAAFAESVERARKNRP